MKKSLLLFVLSLCFATVFAQDAVELKNAGNAALKAKDFKTALEKYEKFLQAPDTFEDAALVFNAGYCALKVNDYEKAAKYFDQSIKNNYKLSSSYRNKAVALKRLKKFPEMVSVLETGIEACPTKNKKMTDMLAKHYLVEGQKFQKNNKFNDAVNAYTKASKLNSPKLKINAFFSLGNLYYNEGAKILQAASPIANSDPDKYKIESAKAKSYFQKALANLNKAKQLDPTREDISNTIKQVEEVL